MLKFHQKNETALAQQVKSLRSQIVIKNVLNSETDPDKNGFFKSDEQENSDQSQDF